MTVPVMEPNLDAAHHTATSTLEVRQAIAHAIDRAQISKIGEGGQQPPANQAGITVPTFDDFATTMEVPCQIFPKDTGLIVADVFGTFSEMLHAADSGFRGWLLLVFRGLVR